MSNQNLSENIRDCIKKAIEEGAKDKAQFRDMRYGIICELKRVGFSRENIEETMMDWNSRNYKKMSYKEFRQQIKSFIKWIFQKNANVGCRFLSENDLCIPNCQFKEKMNAKAKAELSKETYYSEDEIINFLQKYDKNKHPRECAIIYKIIDKKRIKLGVTRDSPIFISLREIATEYWKRGYINPKPMDISRLINELKDSGLLEVAAKGKSGTYKGLANGYKLKIPDDVYEEDIETYNYVV